MQVNCTFYPNRADIKDLNRDKALVLLLWTLLAAGIITAGVATIQEWIGPELNATLFLVSCIPATFIAVGGMVNDKECSTRLAFAVMAIIGLGLIVLSIISERAIIPQTSLGIAMCAVGGLAYYPIFTLICKTRDPGAPSTSKSS